MLAVCRGRIPAIIIFSCATMIVAKASAQSMTSPSAAFQRVDWQAAPALGNDLLRDSENPRSIDLNWILRDDRRTMADGVSPADHSPLPPAFWPNVATRATRGLNSPHIDTHVNTDESASVNDRLVPVPVVSLGWAIALSVVLFNFGARVLRFRRAPND